MRPKIIPAGWMVALLAAGLALAIGLPAEPAAATEVSIEALTATWRDSISAWADKPEGVRRERATRFFAGVSVAHLIRLCSAEPGEGPSSPGSVSGLLEARMRLSPLMFDEIIEILDDLDVQAHCQKTLIRHISLMKETLSRPERETAAEVMLRIADSEGQSPSVRNQLEIAAAELSIQDAVLQRMLTYVDSRAEDLRLQGFSMMVHSRDPRANDILFERLHLLRKQGELPPVSVLIMLGTAKGREAYDILFSFYEMSTREDHLRGATHGMAHSGDPRFMAVLLGLYDDEDTGIRDATSELPDRDERNRHFNLWHMTRLMEPTIVEAFNGDNPELSRQALELIDRQSRYGIPADPSGMAKALRIARERSAGDAAMLERLDQIGARFEIHERAKFERGH